MKDWLVETIHPDVRTCLKIDEPISEFTTARQRVRLFRNRRFGLVLTLDDVVQTTEADEFIYHEAMVHTPAFAHGDVQRALIVGGGDGGALEELLKHRCVERVTMVEIDAKVIELSQQWLGAICGDAFDDPRLTLRIGDGLEFVRDTDQNFDLILIDSTDPTMPDTPAAPLFSREFYDLCRRRLAPGGVLVTQNAVPFMAMDDLMVSMRGFAGLFRDFGAFLASVPSFGCGSMAFGWASDAPELRTAALQTLRARFAAAGVDTNYYTPEVHQASFALPPYIQRHIDAAALDASAMSRRPAPLGVN